MKYEEFCKTHDDSKSDPLVDWIDDPTTTPEDIFAHIGPIPTLDEVDHSHCNPKSHLHSIEDDKK